MENIFDKYYQTPFELHSSKIMDKEHNMAIDFPIKFIYPNSFTFTEKGKERIVNILNGNKDILTDLDLSNGFLKYIPENTTIYLFTEKQVVVFLIIRGWGNLTGKGGGHGLEFEKASKLKLRFNTTKGLLSIEELWDLSLESLDSIAVATDKALETAGKKSFIGKRNTANTVLELQLEILKHVIEVKLAEKEAKASRVAKQAKVAQLKDIIGRKSLTELENKSTDDLLKELEALEAEE